VTLPRSTILYTLGAVATLVIAFVAGRYSAPATVETRTEYLTRTQVVRTTHVRQVTDTKWKTVVVTKPDGSSVATSVGETHTDTKTSETAHSSSDTKSVASNKTEISRPDWQISALVGVNGRSVLNAINSTGPLTPTFGVHVSRRVLGPVSAGAFGLSSGDVGLSIGLNF